MRLNLLLPAQKHVHGTAVVARWLARGDRIDDAASGREAMLRECFAIEATELPVAALTRSIDADDAGDAKWLRADPAFVMADAVTLRLLACGDLGLSADETEAFAQTLKPLFGDAGLPFDAPHPGRWYLRCERSAALPKFSAPEDALGDDLANHLPRGEQARRWRGLLNEVQIVLTQHPVNIQRARRGLPPVNSLWFWGGGVLPAWVQCGFTLVRSDDEVVMALARIASKPSFPRRRKSSSCSLAFLEEHEKKKLDFRLRGNDERRQASSILVDLADCRDLTELEREWLAPIANALKCRQIAQLHLLFESGERYLVKPAHRWRFWRVKSSA